MAAGLHIDEDQLGAEPPADQNILLEDVLVTGATFVACRQVLQARRMANGLEIVIQNNNTSLNN